MSASTIPFFGRAWSLQVLTSPDANNQQQVLTVSSNAWEPESLSITFDINMPVGKALWTADISIYNLNPKTEKLIGEGMEVSLSAGYQNTGTLAEIWRGPIFQPMWERVSVTDYKLTLRCILGLDYYTQNLVSFAHGPYSKQWSVVQKMAQQARTPIPIAYIDPETNFTQQQSPRAKTIFGNPSSLFDQIATQNNMVHFIGPNGLYFGKIQAGSDNPDVTYAPALYPGQQAAPNEGSLTRSLIGTPQQTQYGVNFRVLLDNRIKATIPVMQAKLDMTSVRQLALVPGNYASILDQDGLYMVAGVRHVGDSRGSEWYTEITGLTSIDRKLQMLGPTGSNSLNG